MFARSLKPLVVISWGGAVVGLHKLFENGIRVPVKVILLKNTEKLPKFGKTKLKFGVTKGVGWGRGPAPGTHTNFEKNELTVRGGLYRCVVKPAFKGGFTFSDRISKLVFAWV